MRVPLTTVASELLEASDARAVQFALSRSAHSDIALPLIEAVKVLPDAACYCADPAAFRAALAHVDGSVFAFAEGMSGVTVRLSAVDRAAVLAQGAQDRSELGEGWVFLPLFAGEQPFLRSLPHIVGQAYADTLARGGGWGV